MNLRDGVLGDRGPTPVPEFLVHLQALLIQGEGLVVVPAQAVNLRDGVLGDRGPTPVPEFLVHLQAFLKQGEGLVVVPAQAVNPCHRVFDACAISTARPAEFLERPQRLIVKGKCTAEVPLALIVLGGGSHHTASLALVVQRSEDLRGLFEVPDAFPFIAFLQPKLTQRPQIARNPLSFFAPSIGGQRREEMSLCPFPGGPLFCESSSQQEVTEGHLIPLALTSVLMASFGDKANALPRVVSLDQVAGVEAHRVWVGTSLSTQHVKVRGEVPVSYIVAGDRIEHQHRELTVQLPKLLKAVQGERVLTIVNSRLGLFHPVVGGIIGHGPDRGLQARVSPVKVRFRPLEDERLLVQGKARMVGDQDLELYLIWPCLPQLSFCQLEAFTPQLVFAGWHGGGHKLNIPRLHSTTLHSLEEPDRSLDVLPVEPQEDDQAVCQVADAHSRLV